MREDEPHLLWSATKSIAAGVVAKDRRTNNCPVLVCNHHAERDGYFWRRQLLIRRS